MAGLERDLAVRLEVAAHEDARREDDPGGVEERPESRLPRGRLGRFAA